MSDFIALLTRSTAERVVKIDAVLCLLIKQGAELGELETVTVLRHEGGRREIKLPPRIWFDRIVRAAAVGAFDRLSVKEIADRILAPAPAE